MEQYELMNTTNAYNGSAMDHTSISASMSVIMRGHDSIGGMGTLIAMSASSSLLVD